LEPVPPPQNSGISPGERVDRPSAAERRTEFSRRARILVLAGVAVLVIAVALIVLRALPVRGRIVAERIDSLAVLPLQNFSADTEQEYFADGVTEALITELAHIKALRVVSRTSIVRYKGTRKTTPEIARELNV
jgi:adenylate cyclase